MVVRWKCIVCGSTPSRRHVPQCSNEIEKEGLDIANHALLAGRHFISSHLLSKAEQEAERRESNQKQFEGLQALREKHGIPTPEDARARLRAVEPE